MKNKNNNNNKNEEVSLGMRAFMLNKTSKKEKMKSEN